MQRLGSSVGFGTGTRMAPNKNQRKRGGLSRPVRVDDAPASYARVLRNCAWTVSYVRMEALVRSFRLIEHVNTELGRNTLNLIYSRPGTSKGRASLHIVAVGLLCWWGLYAPIVAAERSAPIDTNSPVAQALQKA